MLYLFSYDIEDDKQRARMHKLLENHGQWVQKSVFELMLDPADLQDITDRATKLLLGDYDSLRIYPLCSECFERVRVIGCGTPPQDSPVFIV